MKIVSAFIAANSIYFATDTGELLMSKDWRDPTSLRVQMITLIDATTDRPVCGPRLMPGDVIEAHYIRDGKQEWVRHTVAYSGTTHFQYHDALKVQRTQAYADEGKHWRWPEEPKS